MNPLILLSWKNGHRHYTMPMSIDGDNSGYNYCKATKPFGFKKYWYLGGDDGHYDFLNWLDGYFSYSHREVCIDVFRSFMAAADDLKRAYDKHILFALDTFTKMGAPARYSPDPYDDELGA